MLIQTYVPGPATPPVAALSYGARLGKTANVVATALALATPGAANSMGHAVLNHASAPEVLRFRLAITRRLDGLREIAADEGLAFSEDSSAYLIAYLMRDAASTQVPAITLQESGELRAIWRNAAGEQAALAFAADGSVQFVAFAKDEDGTMGRAAGRTSARKARAQLDAIGASKLVRN